MSICHWGHLPSIRRDRLPWGGCLRGARHGVGLQNGSGHWRELDFVGRSRRSRQSRGNWCFSPGRGRLGLHWLILRQVWERECSRRRRGSGWRKAVAMDKLLLIAVLGAAGSLVRHHLGGYVHNAGNRSLPPERHFPVGTLFVNVTGSFLLGLVTGLGMAGSLSPLWVAAIGTGFCGALTTFSTWAVDLQRALRAGKTGAFLVNLLLPVLLGVAAAWGGFVVAG